MFKFHRYTLVNIETIVLLLWPGVGRIKFGGPNNLTHK